MESPIQNHCNEHTMVSCSDLNSDAISDTSFHLSHLSQEPGPHPASFRTTTPSALIGKSAQTFPAKSTAWSGPPTPCVHVHKSTILVCKPGDSVALRKAQTLLNGRTSVTRLPLMKQGILSQYSSCFEEIGCFPGEVYKFHLKSEHKPARHAPRKVPIHLEDAFKQEIKSLMDQGILEEVKEHTDWVNSYVIVEKDTGNHHSSNHTIKRKLRICLDPRDLNQALERVPTIHAL